jgi:orotate phosphoribosyltransferase-like protein
MPRKLPRGRPYALPPELIQQARALRDRGLTYRKIGERLNVPYVTAWRACTDSNPERESPPQFAPPTA